jgi:hypothetical protein
VAAAERLTSLKNIVFASYCLVVFIIIVSFVFVHLEGYGFFFFTPGGLALSTQSFNFPIFILFIFGFDLPVPLAAGSVFLMIWMIYVFCFVAAWRWRRSFHAVLAKVLSGSRDIFGNFLSSMPLLSGMALTAALAIIFSQSAVGIGTGEPQLPSNVHEAFLNLAYAPLVEEFGFRIVPIGLIVVLFVFLAGKNVKSFSGAGSRFRLFLLAFVYPEGAKKMSGLPTVGEFGLLKGLSSLEWIMVVVSAAIFGLAHVLSPVGWEIGKITSAFVQGVFFAVTYVAYGFEAPILLHWYFNYYFYFFDPKIAESYFPGTVGLLSAIELLIVVLGVAGWVFFAAEGLRRLLRRLLRRREKADGQPALPPFTSPS